MRAEILVQALRGYRRATIWWIAGIASFVMLNVATYPAMEGKADYDRLLDDMPDAMLALFGIERGLSITSPAGFLISQVFGFLLPMLFVILAISIGSKAIAGEEEAHTLDLLLAQSVSRRRVTAEKLGAVVTVMLFVGAAVWLVLVVSCRVVGLDAGIADLAAATVADLLFGLQSGVLALAVGAARGRRAPAVAVAAAVAVSGFVIESLAQMTDVVARVRWITPYHYVNGNIPMLHGLRVLDVVVLLVLTVTAAAAGAITFERRDLDV